MPGLIDLVPPSSIPLGPIDIGFYGLGYVAAVAVLLWVSTGEARRRGIDPTVVSGSLLLVAAFALVGARVYHVVDQWAYYQEHLERIVLPPYSGLGLYGGIGGAIVGIAVVARRHRLPLSRALDVMVPGTLLAQAIARWGNFFNQELYGPPTEAGWGIAIDCVHRIEPWLCPGDPRLGATGTAYPVETTGFHPLFLYESLLDLVGGLIALALSRRAGRWLRDGDLASFWLVGSGSVRLALETLRSGWNWTFLGVPVAMLIGLLAIALGLGTAAWRRRIPAGARDDRPPVTP